MMLIFLCLNHIEIGEIFQASKCLNYLKKVQFFAKLFSKNLNMVIDNTRTVTELNKEYRLKICIIERINNTLIEFKKLMDDNGKNYCFEWFVTGGMAMRYNGFNRMTYDLDIFMVKPCDTLDDNLEWWQTEIDKILETNGWIHIFDPNQNPDLYDNYGHSWAHPHYKIKVDVVDYDNIDHSTLPKLPNGLIPACYVNNKPLKLLKLADGTNYASIDTLLKIKMNSIHQRDRHDYSGKQKDLEDIMTIEHSINILTLKEVNKIKSDIEHYKIITGNIADYSIPYIISYNLGDNVILLDITLNHKPPNDHSSWTCWRNSYDFLRHMPYGNWIDLPFDVPYKPFSCKACLQKDEGMEMYNVKYQSH